MTDELSGFIHWFIFMYYTGKDKSHITGLTKTGLHQFTAKESNKTKTKTELLKRIQSKTDRKSNTNIQGGGSLTELNWYHELMTIAEALRACETDLVMHPWLSVSTSTLTFLHPFIFYHLVPAWGYSGCWSRSQLTWGKDRVHLPLHCHTLTFTTMDNVEWPMNLTQ